MIEIIENNARKQVVCCNCESIIAYDPIDEIIKEIDGNIEKLIYCPVCGKKNTVDTVYGVDADDIRDSIISCDLEPETVIICHCPICKHHYKFTINEWQGEKYCECGESFYIHDIYESRWALNEHFNQRCPNT